MKTTRPIHWLTIGFILVTGTISGCGGKISARDYLSEAEGGKNCYDKTINYKRAILAESQENRASFQNSEVVEKSLHGLKSTVPFCRSNVSQVLEELAEVILQLRIYSRPKDAVAIANLYADHATKFHAEYVGWSGLKGLESVLSSTQGFGDDALSKKLLDIAVDRSVVTPSEASSLEAMLREWPEAAENYLLKVADLKPILAAAVDKAEKSVPHLVKCRINSYSTVRVYCDKKDGTSTTPDAYPRAYAEEIRKLLGESNRARVFDNIASRTTRANEENRAYFARRESTSSSTVLPALGSVAQIAVNAGGKNAAQYQTLVNELNHTSGGSLADHGSMHLDLDSQKQRKSNNYIYQKPVNECVKFFSDKFSSPIRGISGGHLIIQNNCNFPIRAFVCYNDGQPNQGSCHEKSPTSYGGGDSIKLSSAADPYQKGRVKISFRNSPVRHFACKEEGGGFPYIQKWEGSNFSGVCRGRK